jgi:hypothetical protein
LSSLKKSGVAVPNVEHSSDHKVAPKPKQASHSKNIEFGKGKMDNTTMTLPLSSFTASITPDPEVPTRTHASSTDCAPSLRSFKQLDDGKSSDSSDEEEAHSRKVNQKPEEDNWENTLRAVIQGPSRPPLKISDIISDDDDGYDLQSEEVVLEEDDEPLEKVHRHPKKTRGFSSDSESEPPSADERESTPVPSEASTIRLQIPIASTEQGTNLGGRPGTIVSLENDLQTTDLEFRKNNSPDFQESPLSLTPTTEDTKTGLRNSSINIEPDPVIISSQSALRTGIAAGVRGRRAGTPRMTPEPYPSYVPPTTTMIARRTRAATRLQSQAASQSRDPLASKARSTQESENSAKVTSDVASAIMDIQTGKTLEHPPLQSSVGESLRLASPFPAQDPFAMIDDPKSSSDPVAPLFIATESQTVFPHSQYQDKQAASDSDRETPELESQMATSSSTAKTVLGNAYQKLTEMRSKGFSAFRSASVKVNAQSQSTADLFGPSAKESDAESDSSSSDEEDRKPPKVSHIPLTRRAGKLKTGK